MTNKFVACFVAFLVLESTLGLEDDAYNLLFQDNMDLFIDKPVVFDQPLPSWLRGSLVRVGPALFRYGKRNFTHTFDGFGKLYNWKFYGNGTASFSSNFLRSQTYNLSIEKNDIANFMTFQSVMPRFPLPEQEMVLLNGFDNTNVNIYSIFNGQKNNYEYIALTDAWKIYRIDPLSVGTISVVNAQKPQGIVGFVNQMSSAHPVPEHGTGHHFTFLTSVSVVPGIKSRLSLLRIKSSYDRELVAQWEVDKAPYMHSFSVTQNYVIFFAGPYYINMIRMLEYANAFDGIEWYPKDNATIYVVEIKTGNVWTLPTPTAYLEHHGNAYEENNKIIFDATVYSDPYFSKVLDLRIVKSPVQRNNVYRPPELKRFVVDLKTNTVNISSFQKSKLYPYTSNFDLPCINENFRHLKYCYIYGVAQKIDNKIFSRTALVKKDVCGQNGDKAWVTENHYPVEMWFVPTPNATAEDDGVLLTPVLQGDKRQSYLLMLNATTMTTLNRGYIPSLVPFTIHGRFFSDLV